MPLDAILVAIAVTMMFFTFAVALGWVDRQTRNLPDKTRNPRGRSSR